MGKRGMLFLFIACCVLPLSYSSCQKESQDKASFSEDSMGDGGQKTALVLQDTTAMTLPEDIEVFWDEFKKAVESKKTHELDNVIQFPISIECYADGSKAGKILDSKAFSAIIPKVFDEESMLHMRTYSIEKTLAYYIRKGKVQDIDRFTYGLPHIKVVNGEKDEYSIVLAFRKIQTRWVLEQIFCTG